MGEIVKLKLVRQRAQRHAAATDRTRNAAEGRFVESFCDLVCDHFPTLAAKGDDTLANVGLELLHASHAAELSPQQSHFGAAIATALLRESAERQLEELLLSQYDSDGPGAA